VAKKMVAKKPALCEADDCEEKAFRTVCLFDLCKKHYEQVMNGIVTRTARAPAVAGTKTRCKTCRRFGLWAIGECPECGRNPNPE